MKRTILLTFLLIGSITSFSKGAQSWVQELDLVNLSTLEKDNVASFWTAERNADNDYTSLQEAVQKNKKSIRTAKSNINKFLFSSYSDRADIVIRDTMADSICSYIERDLHLDEIKYLGYNPKAFLTMLEKIGTENDKYYGKKSSHPKTKLRIEVIKALLGESTE